MKDAPLTPSPGRVRYRYERLRRHSMIVGTMAVVLNSILDDIRRKRVDYEELLHTDEIFTFNDECVLCHGTIVGRGNNAEPIRPGKCCDSCNTDVVFARMMHLHPDVATMRWR